MGEIGETNEMSDGDSIKNYGWYSSTIDSHFGRCIYKTPDGSEVKVTTVNQSSIKSPYNDDLVTDCVCIGEVTSFIRDDKTNRLIYFLDNQPIGSRKPLKVLRLSRLSSKTPNLRDLH